MSVPGPRLSKSKLMSGWQCPKRLWLELNGSGNIEYSAETERVFAVGNAVGEMARRQFPDGILIEHDRDMRAALAATAGHLDEPEPVTLFEATLKADDVLVRADVLERDENGRFRLIEVKASAGVKDYHLQDCAIQLWVLERCGLPVEVVELAHINTRFVYGGDVKTFRCTTQLMVIRGRYAA